MRRHDLTIKKTMTKTKTMTMTNTETTKMTKTFRDFETPITFLTFENNNLNIHSDTWIKSDRDSIRNSCDVLVQDWFCNHNRFLLFSKHKINGIYMSSFTQSFCFFRGLLNLPWWQICRMADLTYLWGGEGQGSWEKGEQGQQRSHAFCIFLYPPLAA